MLVEVEIDGRRALVERERLTVLDCVEEHDNARSVATEWRLDGKLVRRDCAVAILRTQAIGGQQMQM
jgi:hypothetical protein